MRDENFHQPDETLMQKLLDEHADDLSGVVLRLAWQEGLSRDEIYNLSWEQVDYEDKRLRLPERDIPLEDGTAECLRRWRESFGSRGATYVASSWKTRDRIAAQSLSRVARTALDSVGMKDVRLIDLRLDFVRRMMDRYDWPYVLRISGLSVTTYRNLYIGKKKHGLPSVPSDFPPESKDARLWQVMQKNSDSPAGIALWLVQQANLTEKEIVELTWADCDLDKGVLHTKRGDTYLTKEHIHILKKEQARRGPADDPHVILTPRSRKPLDVARLSTLIRNLLVRSGLDGMSANDLRRAERIRLQKERILRQAEANGSITRREVETLLGVKSNIAYSRLVELAESGELVYVSRAYLPARQAVPREKWPEAVREYIAEKGGAYNREIAELLHIGKSTAGRLLRRMADSGELVMIRQNKEYLLPAASGQD